MRKKFPLFFERISGHWTVLHGDNPLKEGDGHMGDSVS